MNFFHLRDAVPQYNLVVYRVFCNGNSKQLVNNMGEGDSFTCLSTYGLCKFSAGINSKPVHNRNKRIRRVGKHVHHVQPEVAYFLPGKLTHA